MAGVYDVLGRLPAPQVDWNVLGDYPATYEAGQERGRQNELRRRLAQLPQGPGGVPDYGAAVQAAFQAGTLGQLPAMGNLLAQQAHIRQSEAQLAETRRHNVAQEGLTAEQMRVVPFGTDEWNNPLVLVMPAHGTKGEPKVVRASDFAGGGAASAPYQRPAWAGETPPAPLQPPQPVQAPTATPDEARPTARVAPPTPSLATPTPGPVPPAAAPPPRATDVTTIESPVPANSGPTIAPPAQMAPVVPVPVPQSATRAGPAVEQPAAVRPPQQAGAMPAIPPPIVPPRTPYQAGNTPQPATAPPRVGPTPPDVSSGPTPAPTTAPTPAPGPGAFTLPSPAPVAPASVVRQEQARPATWRPGSDILAGVPQISDEPNRDLGPADARSVEEGGRGAAKRHWDVLDKMEPRKARLVEMVAEYNYDPYRLPIKNRLDIVEKAKEFKPSYEPNNYNNFKVGQQQYQGGPDSRTVRALSVALDHIKTYELFARAMNQPNNPRLFNEARAAWMNQFNSPAPNNLAIASQIVANEVNKAIMNGSSGAVHDREENNAALSRSNSLKTALDAANTYKAFLGGQIMGFRYQFPTRTNRNVAEFDKTLSPSAREMVHQLDAGERRGAGGPASQGTTSGGVNWSLSR
jgi:hypothetical protein